MAVDLLTDYQYTDPPSEASVNVTLPGGSNWDDSDTVTIFEAADVASVLLGVTVRPVTINTPSAAYNYEVEICTGPDGNLVPIATWPALMNNTTTQVGGEGLYLHSYIGIDLIGLGAHVSVRMRGGTTDEDVYAVAITRLKKPLAGNLLTTTQPLRCLPAAADAIEFLTAASAWVDGSFATLRPASGAALVVAGLMTYNPITFVNHEIDLHTGQLGSESADPITTIRSNQGAATGTPRYIALPNPLDNIGVNQGLVIKGRCESPAARTLLLKLAVFEKPL